jgi:DNA repair exonuclease SbcCD ATPase subunit
MNSTDLATENQMLKAKIAALTELCDEFDALRDELSKRVERLRRMIPKYRHLRKALKEAHSKSRAIEAELAELKKIMAENEKNRGDFDPGHKGKPFVEHANRLDKIGQTDAALDLIYDRIDTLLVKGKFEEVDSVLRDADPKRLSVDILLGLLTSTLPARTKLSTRAKFFAEVEREIRRRDQWEDGLLTGLESQP